MNKVAVVGLGYVGLPLAVAFGKQHATIGFDLDERKIGNYRHGTDPTGEVEAADLKAATRLEFTSDPARDVQDIGGRLRVDAQADARLPIRARDAALIFRIQLDGRHLAQAHQSPRGRAPG